MVSIETITPMCFTSLGRKYSTRHVHSGPSHPSPVVDHPRVVLNVRARWGPEHVHPLTQRPVHNMQGKFSDRLENSLPPPHLPSPPSLPFSFFSENIRLGVPGRNYSLNTRRLAPSTNSRLYRRQGEGEGGEGVGSWDLGSGVERIRRDGRDQGRWESPRGWFGSRTLGSGDGKTLGSGRAQRERRGVVLRGRESRVGGRESGRSVPTLTHTNPPNPTPLPLHHTSLPQPVNDFYHVTGERGWSRRMIWTGRRTVVGLVKLCLHRGKGGVVSSRIHTTHERARGKGRHRDGRRGNKESDMGKIGKRGNGVIQIEGGWKSKDW